MYGKNLLSLAAATAALAGALPALFGSQNTSVSQCAANLTKIKPEVKTETKPNSGSGSVFGSGERSGSGSVFGSGERSGSGSVFGSRGERSGDQDQFLDQARDQDQEDQVFGSGERSGFGDGSLSGANSGDSGGGSGSGGSGVDDGSLSRS